MPNIFIILSIIILNVYYLYTNMAKDIADEIA